MARFMAMQPPPPIKIDKFYGINKGASRLGEALYQANFRITKDMKPEKREGHSTFINTENAKDIQGMWHGEIGGKNILVYCNNGKAWEYNFTTETTSELGEISDLHTQIISFNGRLIFLNGVDFMYYDGETFDYVHNIAYVPTVYLPPKDDTLTPTPFEPINLLTGYKKQEFQGDGVATEFQLAETDIDNVPAYVWVDGVEKTEGTYPPNPDQFHINRETGVVSLSSGEGSLIKVQWCKNNLEHPYLVRRNFYASVFGPGNDTALFIWGNPYERNRRSWCASNDVTYWPVTNFTNIGTDDYYITDIKAMGANYQMIFKEDRTYYSVAESINGVYDYPVYDLNESVGNVVKGGVQIVNNSALSIKNGWWLWNGTAVEDERNVTLISERLDLPDLKNAITFDYQAKKEYWCCVDGKVYIWNYGNDTMYIFDNISATCFLDIDGVLYFGSQGKIEKFDGLDDNGVEITSRLETGFYTFGGFHLIKSSDRAFIGLMPDSKTSVTVYFRTNKMEEYKPIRKIANYNLTDFDDMDFDDFSFLTNSSPQPFALDFTSGDYSYIQFIFENKEIDESCNIQDFLVNAEIQGEI